MTLLCVTMHTKIFADKLVEDKGRVIFRYIKYHLICKIKFNDDYINMAKKKVSWMSSINNLLVFINRLV